MLFFVFPSRNKIRLFFFPRYTGLGDKEWLTGLRQIGNWAASVFFELHWADGWKGAGRKEELLNAEEEFSFDRRL